MGKLIYGWAGNEIAFTDRDLAHLQLVTGAKLRRGECFFFSWKEDIGHGSGRGSIWLHPAIPLQFVYYSGKPQDINPEWLQVLTRSANSTRGLQLTPEPIDEATTPGRGANGL